MKILITGCSFSSGWGFEQGKDDPSSWPEIVRQKFDCSIHNLAETGNSNTDIFLSLINEAGQKNYDLIVFQATALDRISVSPSPMSGKINLLNFDEIDDHYRAKFSSGEIENFKKIYVTLNQSWKSFFDFVVMCNVCSKLPIPVVMINGLMPWGKHFWTTSADGSIDSVTKDLIQFDQYPDSVLFPWLEKVTEAKQTIKKLHWINLERSWQCAKIDTISSRDQHPGPLSQHLFAEQVVHFLKENYA
jgi:hypothetical protein